ncbi:MAG: T9SS type A sorting domain-containing protein [Bacteroidales bacterium]|jgi:hypothetical protein|nr:T9SS type A sorting domain-containing protein [Bacteroidales bacterium]
MGWDDYGNRVNGNVIRRLYYGTIAVADIQFNDPGAYIISTYAVSPCGNGNVVDIYNFYVYEFRTSFNPVLNKIEIYVDGVNAAKKAGAVLDQFTITISDNNGTYRTQNNYSGNQFSIPAGNLSDGTYSVKISNGKITETKELVIKR